MNFEFYKRYLKPFHGFPDIKEVDKLISDIYEYNTLLTKSTCIDGVLSINYFDNVTYIFDNGLNIFSIFKIDETSKYFEMRFNFNLFIEIYICAKSLYHEMGSELYDMMLDYFKWCLKVTYSYIDLLVQKTWLSGDCEGYVNNMDDFCYGILMEQDINYTAIKMEKSNVNNQCEPSWYNLIMDNWNDVSKNIKRFFAESSWYDQIIKNSKTFGEEENFITPDNTFESIDYIIHILGCIWFRIHFDNVTQPYKKAIPELTDDDFRYYKLEKGIEWKPDESLKDESVSNDISDYFNIKLPFDEHTNKITRRAIELFPFLRKVNLNTAAAFAYVWTHNCDGDHHKQWVIDQMLKHLLTENEYNQYIKAYVKWYNNDHEEKATEEDLSQEIHGIAP